MTKRWGPNLVSEPTKTKRSAVKKQRRAARVEAEMAAIAEEYGLDPLGDFMRELAANGSRKAKRLLEG